MSKKPEVTEIGCLEALEGLYAYLDGEMNDQDAVATIEHHLSHCRVCYSRIEMEKLLSDRIRKSAQSVAPETLRARMKNILKDL